MTIRAQTFHKTPRDFAPFAFTTNDMTLSEQAFEEKLAAMRDEIAGRPLAVAVSGGPDSMALLWLLARWNKDLRQKIFVYTVDHGLRAESADEAARVQSWISGWQNVSHRILRWEGDKPETRILEAARVARYALLAAAMKRDGAESLFIGHHRDDQAETFLIRLAKGSGLDGLAGMRAVQESPLGIKLLRPLLDVPKQDLVDLCRAENIPFVEDPTNENEEYLRPRLRAAQRILAEEGLSAKRLSVTAGRLARARDALERLSLELFDRAVTARCENGLSMDFNMLRDAPEELVLRALLRAMEEVAPADDYGPRMEKLETLMARILGEADFKGATLGGCVFAKRDKNRALWVGKEEG